MQRRLTWDSGCWIVREQMPERASQNLRGGIEVSFFVVWYGVWRCVRGEVSGRGRGSAPYGVVITRCDRLAWPSESKWGRRREPHLCRESQTSRDEGAMAGWVGWCSWKTMPWLVVSRLSRICSYDVVDVVMWWVEVQPKSSGLGICMGAVEVGFGGHDPTTGARQCQI